MTKAAFWSSDWAFEDVVDEQATAFYGRTKYVPGQKRASYGGTYYYRLAMPGMELAKHGYESILTYRFGIANDGHLVIMDLHGDWHDNCDIVVMQRHMARDIDVVIERAKATGQVIINDLDDNFWGLPKSNIARDTTDPVTHPEFNRDHYRKAIAASSAITVSTPALAKEVESLGPPVFLCRNMIDIERWPQLDPTTDGMIGWIGGIQWRANDMQVLRQFLPSFLEDYGLPFYHGGDSQVEGVAKAFEQIGINHKVTKCAVAPICNIGEYPGLWQPLNISLIPLEDVKFNHSKSTLKQLESSACGLPYIVSDLVEQKWFVEDGGMGRLAKNWKPQTWADHLEALLDPETRRIEGNANRAHAEQFDIRDRWTQWDDVYSDLLVTV